MRTVDLSVRISIYEFQRMKFSLYSNDDKKWHRETCYVYKLEKNVFDVFKYFFLI